MAAGSKPKYYLVEASVLPEIFAKVIEAKELLETGQVRTVADAVARVDISRSAFYKYKDFVSPFQDMSRGHLVTFNLELLDRQGVLSSVLAIFAENGANIPEHSDERRRPGDDHGRDREHADDDGGVHGGAQSGRGHHPRAPHGRLTTKNKSIPGPKWSGDVRPLKSPC
jgi:hypothetical protein